LECAFGVLGKILMSRNEIYLVINIGFEVISTAENSNEFLKTRFWKEKSVEDRVTLGPTARPH
jgi:hypothetical protein